MNWVEPEHLVRYWLWSNYVCLLGQQVMKAISRILSTRKHYKLKYIFTMQHHLLLLCVSTTPRFTTSQLIHWQGLNSAKGLGFIVWLRTCRERNLVVSSNSTFYDFSAVLGMKMKVISTDAGASLPAKDGRAEILNSSLEKYSSLTVCARFQSGVLSSAEILCVL